METENSDLTYNIKTPVFEGPFGLLLSLVEKRKLFINDVSLASVTEDYLNYVNGLENKDPMHMSSFIVVASTLLLIKSKSLLPNLVFTEEEEVSIKDLEDRLALYELYSNLTQNIKEKFGKKIIFMPIEHKIETVVFLPDERITKYNMMILAQDIVNKLPKKVILPKVEIRKVISIEEMIGRLTERINDALKMSFKEFSRSSNASYSKEEKVNIIVSFLAVLELARQGVLSLVQENNFDDIMIQKQEILIEENNIINL